MYLNQRKYIMDLIGDTGLTVARPTSLLLYHQVPSLWLMATLSLISQRAIAALLVGSSILISLALILHMGCNNLSSSSPPLAALIGMSLCIFFVISKVLLPMASSIHLVVLFFSKCSQMLIGPPVLTLVVLYLVIVCSSALPSSLGEPRNNPWFLDPPLRLSTVAWLLLLESFSGVSISFRIF